MARAAETRSAAETERVPYYTSAELDQMSSELTMGDVWRVREIEDDAERGASLYWRAAIRLGLHTGTLEDFLDRVLEADFAKLLADGRSRGQTADEPSSRSKASAEDSLG